jgi:hypothetical protein
MPGKTRLAGALAVVATAMAISACGSSSDNATIPQQNADELNAALNSAQAAVEAGNCKEAENAAGDFIDAVNNLPDSVSTDDKDGLRAAGANLEKLAQDPSQCKPDTGTTGLPGQQTTTSTTEPTTTVPTTTTPTTTSTTTTTSTPPPETGGGNEGGGGGPPSSGGGPPSTGGGNTGGGGVGGGSGGTGGTGTGGTGGTG